MNTKLETAKVGLIPVPWDVTTSYGGGTCNGPSAILEASPQIDHFDFDAGRSFEGGDFHMLDIPKDLLALNHELRPRALKIRHQLEDSGQLHSEARRWLESVNLGCQKMVDWVYQQSRSLIESGKIPAVIGGDHSTPHGNIRAVSESVKGHFGLLHIDAHADLRHQYQGFTHSHASIMNNVMNADWRPQKLVQVGIRDFCLEEFEMSDRRTDIETHYDRSLKKQLFEGRTWNELCQRILEPLPAEVYVSFDIDGLSPEFCPHTGTPVPGGLSFDQAVHLLTQVIRSGRKIIGFDLNEVSPGPDSEWDGNVGARVLFKMCCLSLQ